MMASVRAAQAAASILVVRCQLCGPPDAGLLPAAAAAFGAVSAASTASLPELPAAAADAVRLACWAALPVLADAVALLSAASEPVTAAEVQAACSSHPQPLAVAMAAALAGPTGGAGGAWQCSHALSAALCRALAALLQREHMASTFLLAAPEQEYTVPAPAGGSTTAEPTQPVGAVLCAYLINLFVEAAAAEAAAATGIAGLDSELQPERRSLVLQAALGGLLAHSQPAKQMALDVGFHAFLLDTCRSLAAGRSSVTDAPAATSQQAPMTAKPEPCSRAIKLQQLKQQRRRGKCHLAFGSRARGARTDTRVQPGRPMQQPCPATCVAEEGSAAAALPPASAAPMPGCAWLSGKVQQRLLQLLQLLQQFSVGSPSACDAVGATGLLQLAEALLQLWGTGSPVGNGSTMALHSMLRLLGCVLASSQATRHAFATGGEQLFARARNLVLWTRAACTGCIHG